MPTKRARLSASPIYRTSKPEVVALWAKWQKESRAWQRRVRKMLKELFPDTPPGVIQYKVRPDPACFYGVVPFGSPAYQPPPGWKYDRNSYCWTPLKKSKEGKAIDAMIEATGTGPDARAELPGMPRMVFSGLSMLRPAIKMHGDAMYVEWSAPLDKEEAKRVDLDIWENVKLSEYHAMLEAEEQSA